MANFCSNLKIDRWAKTPGIPGQRIMAIPRPVSGPPVAHRPIAFARKASQVLLNLSRSKPDIGTRHLIDEVS
jgi:hypothetical protein